MTSNASFGINIAHALSPTHTHTHTHTHTYTCTVHTHTCTCTCIAHTYTHNTNYMATVEIRYRALQVTCQRLEAWLTCYVECHHGNASLNQVTNYSKSNKDPTESI